MAQSLSNLPVGAKVKFGKYSVNGETAQPITWVITAKNHKGDATKNIPDYPDNSVTLLTEKIIDYRFFDNPEPDSTEYDMIQTYGRSTYSTSNIDQWLNKDGEAGQWFVKQHDTDHAPDGEHATSYTNQDGTHTFDHGTAYINRPGFLNAFSQDEKNAILTTSIRCLFYKSRYVADNETIERKIFLPSAVEVTGQGDGKQGVCWEWFETNYPVADVTVQAYENSPCTLKNQQWWWTRTPYDIYRGTTVGNERHNRSEYAIWGNRGVRPALNISSTTFVSDTTDSDGAYTTVFNFAPPAPNTLSVPDTIYGGKNNTISWSSVIDPEGDSVTYELDCVYDGGTVFTTIYSGASLSYNHAVVYGKTSVQYRVRAIDSKGEASVYTTSPSRTVTNNLPPTLAIVSNATTTDTSASMSYSVFDAEGEIVTIDEYVDNEKIYTHTVQSSSPKTVDMTINRIAWTRLSNGSHTIRIVATDSNGGTSEISSTFTKLVETIDITTKAMESSERPNRITLTIARVIPEDAIFKVFVCNNALDATPVWENATESVLKGDPHMFDNDTKTSSKWAVKVEIVVERNGAEGSCYISSIGGAFD